MVGKKVLQVVGRLVLQAVDRKVLPPLGRWALQVQALLQQAMLLVLREVLHPAVKAAQAVLLEAMLLLHLERAAVKALQARLPSRICTAVLQARRLLVEASLRFSWPGFSFL